LNTTENKSALLRHEFNVAEKSTARNSFDESQCSNSIPVKKERFDPRIDGKAQASHSMVADPTRAMSDGLHGTD
jgi:hypothetical protein